MARTISSLLAISFAFCARSSSFEEAIKFVVWPKSVNQLAQSNAAPGVLKEPRIGEGTGGDSTAVVGCFGSETAS